jgi:hypothetical protein
MSGPVSLSIEEPVGPNSELDAVDEVGRRLTLADFEVRQVYRYSLRWQRGDRSFKTECPDVFEQLAALSAGPFTCIAGWKHDTQGDLRMRHKILCTNLRASGWHVVAEMDVGVATTTFGTGGLSGALEIVNDHRLGWFVGFGEWCRQGALVHPPFLETMRFFCANDRLAPSHQFLTALGAAGGAVAYPLPSDNERPQVVFIAAERMAARLEPLVVNER